MGASRDLHNIIKTTRLVSPAAIITGNVTTTSQTIDTQGFESLELVTTLGAFTDSTQTPTVFEGDVANMSDEAAVAAGDLLGTAPAMTSADANTVKKVGYKGNKRYVRIKYVQTAATTGCFLSAVAVQANAKNAPVA